ncbi:hypothetical protein BD410DRAFT_810696, partial [Rickenella mellea]
PTLEADYNAYREKQRAKGEPVMRKFVFMNDMVKKSYLKETDEVKAEVEAYRLQAKDGEISEYLEQLQKEMSEDKAARYKRNHDIQVAQDGLPRFFQKLADTTTKKTGMVVTILVSGPEPKSGGDVTSFAVHSHLNGMNFAEYLGSKWEPTFALFNNFARDRIDEETRRSYALVSFDNAMSDGLEESEVVANTITADDTVGNTETPDPNTTKVGPPTQSTTSQAHPKADWQHVPSWPSDTVNPADLIAGIGPSHLNSQVEMGRNPFMGVGNSMLDMGLGTYQAPQSWSMDPAHTSTPSCTSTPAFSAEDLLNMIPPENAWTLDLNEMIDACHVPASTVNAESSTFLFFPSVPNDSYLSSGDAGTAAAGSSVFSMERTIPLTVASSFSSTPLESTTATISNSSSVFSFASAPLTIPVVPLANLDRTGWTGFIKDVVDLMMNRPVKGGSWDALATYYVALERQLGFLDPAPSDQLHKLLITDRPDEVKMWLRDGRSHENDAVIEDVDA